MNSWLKLFLRRYEKQFAVRERTLIFYSSLSSKTGSSSLPYFRTKMIVLNFYVDKVFIVCKDAKNKGIRVRRSLWSLCY
jgi:hypothetical protein